MTNFNIILGKAPSRNETSQVALTRPNRSSSVTEIKPRPRPATIDSVAKIIPRNLSTGTTRTLPPGGGGVGGKRGTLKSRKYCDIMIRLILNVVSHHGQSS